MGYALAEAAARRGARVVLLTGPTALAASQVRSAAFPEGAIQTIAVQTAEEMAEAAGRAWPTATIGILSAAVADYRAAEVSPGKLKKSGERLVLELTPTRDVLAELGAGKQTQFLAGFAAETESGERALAYARGKLESKNADLIVLNDVSRADIGFDAADNAVTLVWRGGERGIERAAKTVIADRILDEIVALQATRPHRAPARA